MHRHEGSNLQSSHDFQPGPRRQTGKAQSISIKFRKAIAAGVSIT